MARNIEDLLGTARDRLSRAFDDLPRREAGLLIAKTLDTTEAGIFAHPERVLSAEEELRFENVLARRLAGEPVAYLFGQREFWGRAFAVDTRVLIPRRETEHLVEVTLRLAPFGARVVDVGTGSGCIGITLALERPDLAIVASDISPAALAVAARNRATHDARLALVAGDLLTALRPEQIDLVVANLPYVSERELADASGEVRDYEPASALVAADNGLALMRALLSQCRSLAANTHVLLEIGATQADAVTAMAAEYHLRLAEKLSDYAGHDRVLVFCERGPR